jgi:Ca2+-binding EF-hand superfamily protein
MTRYTLVRELKFSERGAISIFAKFDQQGVGYIDTYEFLCCIILMSDATFDEKAKMLFDLYDVDKSQTLTMDECKILISSSYAALYVLEDKPKPHQSQVNASLETFFKHADLDHD